jgi:thiol-disulfide isomerase/thioredoxin
MNRRHFLRNALTLAPGAAALLAARGPARAAADNAGNAGVPAEALAALLARPLVDLQGQASRLSDWRGRPMVINFWATWCAPCVKEMPELDAQHQRRPKAQFVGIGIDSSDNIRKFLLKTPVSYPVLVMGSGAIDLLRSLGNPAGGLPFTLVLDAQGRVKRKILGAIKFDDFSATLDALG